MGNTCQTSLHKCYKLCDCEEIPSFTFNTENECSLSFHSNNINSKSINNNTINNNSNINQSNINSYSNQVILSNNVSSISIQNDEDDNDNTFQLNSQPHIILTSPYKSNNSSNINLSSFIANFNTETNYSSESLNSPLSPHFYSAQPFSSRTNNNNNNNNTNDITTYTTNNNNNNIHTKDSIVLQKILLIQSTFKSFLISKRESEYNLLKNKKSISTSDITNSIPKASIFLSYLKSNYTIIHPPNCKRHSKQGICKILWEDNSLLIGNYINNQLNGVGDFQLQNSSIYKGYFKHNLFNGYGVYITPEKTKIEGMWVKGKLNGFVIEQFKDGTIYKGEYSNSLRNGIGLYQHSSGWIYRGEFKNNKMEGIGMIHYSDRYYQGEFKGGMFEGYGEFHWNKGIKYIGLWKKGMKNIFGVYTNVHKRQAYIGFWKNNKMDGVGVIYDDSGAKFGKWKEGVKINNYVNYNDAINNIIDDKDKMYIPFFFRNREEATVLFY